jgi:hypothetical protein
MIQEATHNKIMMMSDDYSEEDSFFFLSLLTLGKRILGHEIKERLKR